MKPFARTLVPLSLTDSDAGLLRYARILARCGITETFLFAHAAPAEQPDLDLIRRKTEIEALVSAEFAPFAGANVIVQVGRGPRVDWLIKTAADFHADLTLLGHRKARSGTRSLAQRLSQFGPSSVWLVPEGSLPEIRSVLAPVDFSEHSGHSLSIATALARASGHNRCLATHTSFDPSTLRYYENVLAARNNERSEFASFLNNVELHGVEVETRLEESPKVAASILRVAAEEKADLIVMGTRGRSRAVAILLGSVTAKVMSESPVPVLAVKHPGARLNMFQLLSEHRSWLQPNPKTN